MELDMSKEIDMFKFFEADVYDVRPSTLTLSQLYIHWGRGAVTMTLVSNRRRRDRTVDNTIQPNSHDTSMWCHNKECDSDRLYNYKNK